MTWDPSVPGVLTLPSGRRVRGRALRHTLPEGMEPDYGLYLLGHVPNPTPWPSDWIRWKDFRVPRFLPDAARLIRLTWERCADERVEVACGGGRGRTGTVMACLAALDGVPGDEAVAFVRANYHRRAVETPGQRRFVRSFAV